MKGEFYTVREMAEILQLRFENVKSRLYTRKIKPITYIGKTGLYNTDVLEQIRTARPAHRPNISVTAKDAGDAE